MYNQIAAIMGRLKFYKTTDSGYVSEKLAGIIDGELTKRRRVLWLLSGGSAITVAVGAAKLLSASDVSMLSVGLIDERYGPPGHADSNWAQLQAAGFKLPGGQMIPVLDGSGIEQTTRKYNRFISSMFNPGVYKIGLMGIGSDGHTAGLLPGSRAAESTDFVVSYQGPDYRRITLSARGIAGLDKAVVYASGKAKQIAIDNLAKEIPPSSQPAQLLKLIDDVDVYNDIKGEKI